MTYIRKTYDEYEIQGYTGPQYGWEVMTTETDPREAKARLREYRENQPEYPYRIVKRRVKKESA